MRNKCVVGISGVATSGKDTFYSLCREQLVNSGYEVRRYALADELKLELRDFCLLHYNIDPVSCSREDKEKIRNLLVFHGNFKRDASQGSHWMKKIVPKIEEDLNKFDKIVCFITDIRYCKYENDELYYLKKMENGILVHVTQYCGRELIYKQPANEQEKLCDPLMQQHADYKLSWPMVQDLKDLNPYIINFLNNEIF